MNTKVKAIDSKYTIVWKSFLPWTSVLHKHILWNLIVTTSLLVQNLCWGIAEVKQH